MNSYGPRETLIRALPTTPVPDIVKRLSRSNVGQCQSLSFTGIHSWTLGEFCAVIEAASHLTPEIVALDFSKMELDELFLSFAIDLVDRCPKLKRLSFDDNYFTSVTSAELLGKALQSKTQLSYLSLTHCRLNNEGATRLLKCIFETDGGKSSSVNTSENKASSSMSTAGFALHLSHNLLTTHPFVEDMLAIISNRKHHRLNSVSLFGNFISNHEALTIHNACAARRAYSEKAPKRTDVHSPAVGLSALRLLVECAEESEKNSFPNVLAMAKLLEDEN